MMDHVAKPAQAPVPPGTRRFGRVNWLGLWTLSVREVRRFLVVWTQTIAAPLVTSGLFVTVFSFAFAGRRPEVLGLPFMHFLVPGILMMSVIQNAFANSSSSLVISKIQGNIVDTLMPPLSAGEILAGYLAGALGRGLLVAGVIAAVIFPLTGLGLAHPLRFVAIVALGALMLGGLGVLAGLWAEKFDQMAAVTNFVITPASFLSGTFYAVSGLPEPLATISHLNPVFHLIDGARGAVTGVMEGDPLTGFAVTGGTTAAVVALCWWLIRTGYRLKA